LKIPLRAKINYFRITWAIRSQIASLIHKMKPFLQILTKPKMLMIKFQEWQWLIEILQRIECTTKKLSKPHSRVNLKLLTCLTQKLGSLFNLCQITTTRIKTSQLRFNFTARWIFLIKTCIPTFTTIILIPYQKSWFMTKSLLTAIRNSRKMINT
jgi:hypothetical protein